MKKKNPNMVEAGKKAYKTKMLNLAAKKEKRSQAGLMASITKKANAVALPSLTKVAIIAKEDIPKELLQRFDKLVGSTVKGKRVFDLTDVDWILRLEGDSSTMDCISDEPLGNVSMAIFNRTKDCTILKIV